MIATIAAASIGRLLVERRLNVTIQKFDPYINVDAGTLYLARMMDRFDGDTTLALAAYHAGPGNARRYQRARRIPGSVRSYVERVLAARDRLAPIFTPGAGRRLTRR